MRLILPVVVCIQEDGIPLPQKQINHQCSDHHPQQMVQQITR